MPEILFDVPLRVTPREVFHAMTTPAGLNAWWTKQCTGEPGAGAYYDLWFGPEYDWKGTVRVFEPDVAFELEMIRADADWTGTRVGFRLERRAEDTLVHFYHSGWRTANQHFRISAYCWGTYLRILRRFLVYGERVPYEERDEV